MSKQIFIIHGDVTQLAADALAYPTSLYGGPGHLFAAFERNLPAFSKAYRDAMREAGVSDRRRPCFPEMRSGCRCRRRRPLGETAPRALP